MTGPDGAALALKTWRRPRFGDAEAAAPSLLRAWRGRGAVPILRAQPEAMLMPWMQGPSAGDVFRAGGDGDTILAQAVAALPSVGRGQLDRIEDLRRRCHALLHLPLGRIPRPADRIAMARARGLCRTLLVASAPSCVLHGDIHHDNILYGPSGWCVMDPTPTFGDPAYEFGNVFRNHEGATGLDDPVLILRRAALGVRALHRPFALVLAWGAVRTALSIAWSVEDGHAAPRDDLGLLHRFLSPPLAAYMRGA